MKHTETLDIPPVLQSKLEEFRSRLWSIKIGEGALAGIAGLILSFLFVFILDRFIDTPVWLRWMLLFLGFAVPAVGIPIRYHKWVWQKRSLGQIARVLRKRYPRLGDELLGIVDLAKERQSKGHSQTLITAAMNQVAEKVKDQDFSGAVPENHYRKWVYASAGMGGIVLLAIIVVSGAAQSSVARWMTPWRLIERYTFAKIEPIQHEMVVPFAEKFDLSTRLKETTEWKPEAATVRLPGKTRLNSEINDREAYEFLVPPQKDDASLSLRVGDAVEKIKIKPVPRPELTNLSAKVRLPDYLMYQRDPVIPIRGGTVDLVEGATASFVGSASRELTKASVNGSPAALSGTSFSTRPDKVEGTETMLFEWEDSHGLSAKSPFELRVNAIPDAAPDVFARKTSVEQVVLQNEVVTFEINSSDDFGIREVGLEWVGIVDPIHNPTPAVGGKMVATGGAEEKTIEARGTFSAERNFIKPQTLQIRAYAEDYLPNRSRTYSPVFVLHVMDPSDHANWLTNEFGKWFSRAREVYEREQQLHEANRDLRSLSAGELDRPENRRKLERQASAESSNARRLEALTSSGRDLVRQATKNDEFDANRLESWAKMMRALDDISKNKMPSVADLLKKSAQAAGGQQSKQGESKEDQESKASSPSSPSVQNQNGEDSPDDSQKTGESGENKPPQLPKAPSISDSESSLEKDDPKADDKKGAQNKDSKGRLSLPATTLKGEAEDEEEQKEASPPESPSQEQLDLALKEQQDLLAEFAKVADELQEILSSLEASTFVKRLKASSRRQLSIAKTLNDTITGGFGISRDRITAKLQEVAFDTAKAEEEESDKLYTIQSDLDAYYQRKQDLIYKNVLDQMRKSAVVTRLKKLGEEASDNYNGRSIAAAEYWSDTLDRWAEELVAASQGQQQEEGEAKDKKSLPPEIVLEVMKVARGEMDLREETRELDNIKTSLSPDEYAEKTKPLELVQTVLRSRVDDVVLDIMDIPEAEENFGNELQLLNLVSDVMRQARGELSRPNTGPEVIAAQTEAIELLLQTRRQPPNKGGGGGGGSPGGGSSGESPGGLSDININPGAPVEPTSGTKRSVGQSTGKTGQEFPEEFRHGLDSYFNELEKIR
ncbi:MAG: hypothetical protein P1V20_11030 [Verrucomicrobiales bacterium]|nr:hypothetical protein [Verrucomicrobiales bacterium]